MVIADLSGGGAQRVFTQLANGWAERGRRICVITLSSTDQDFFHLSSQVQRVCIGGLGDSNSLLASIKANVSRIRSLRAALRKLGAPTVLSFIGVMNVLTILATIGLGTKLVISERNDPALQSLGKMWDFLRRKTYGKADVITANSSGAIKTIESWGPIQAPALVPNPVSVPLDSKRIDLPGPAILNVGRLVPQKAQDILLNAFSDVLKKAPDWYLVIVGTGPRKDKLREQADQLGISNRVLFPGQIDDPYPYYRTARIFALPSLFEGTPNTLLEAMACGLPCVVSDASSGPLDYIEDQKTGLVVSAGGSDELALTLTRLIEDEPLCERLGSAARDCTEALGIDQVLDFWEETIGFHPPSSPTG
jgi:GalNAc-alpha-(1->4)-GalNAc-alpha-(1->3)-diNAcBac-PP-undecaprenol alpha-1,4-N-acetyl-D-galactosaminyltransferase